MKRACLTAFAAVLALVAGCSHPQPAAPGARSAATGAPAGQPRFADVTPQAGISWVHNPCRTGRKLLPETVGGGGGFLDYDRDGKLDILLVNGAPLPGYSGPRPHLALYHNNGSGTFTDVAGSSGLDYSGYGMGAAVADYDNDGWPDVYITGVGGSRLYHNEHGRFRDVTAESGTAVDGFATGATWLDYDRDGKLDLFVARYVDWSVRTDLPCGPPTARQYCPPNQYRGAPPVLFHNLGSGRFQDVSARAGVLGHPSKTLSVSLYDFNGDGWPDLYLANDTEPDVLLINDGHGGFTDSALSAGVAVGTDGNPTGSMGVDIATPFADGRTAIAVGTFAGQEMSLFVTPPNAPAGALLFDNRKQEAGIAAPTRPMTTFGTLFVDVDLDGWPDLVAANGHIDDDPSLSVNGDRVPYRQPVQLFHNLRSGAFEDVAQAAGLAHPIIGRGLACADLQGNGLDDLLIFENGGPVKLWRNVTEPVGSWIGIKLTGTRGPRDGTGAMVTVSGPGWQQTRCATSARSFLSVCDPRVLFGVGRRQVDRITVRWPLGDISTVEKPATNRYMEIVEAK